MAEIVIDVMDLIGPLRPASEIKNDEEDMLVEFSENPSPTEITAGFRKLWGMVLLMSVRDRATSVHYHPWRADGALCYIVDNVRYEMVPPPESWAHWCVETARTTFTEPAGFFARLFGRGRVSCGTLRLEIATNPILWEVVVWSSGGRSGVEMYRVTPVEPPKAKTDGRGPNDTLPI